MIIIDPLGNGLIIKELRKAAGKSHDDLLDRAADEIERLRDQVAVLGGAYKMSKAEVDDLQARLLASA